MHKYAEQKKKKNVDPLDMVCSLSVNNMDMHKFAYASYIMPLHHMNMCSILNHT